MEVEGVVLEWCNGRARVQIDRSECARCPAPCPARSLFQSSAFLADAPDRLEPGQRVRIRMPAPSPGLGAGAVFGPPVLGLMAGVITGDWAFRGHPWAITGLALLGLAVGILPAWAAERRDRPKVVSEVVPHISGKPMCTSMSHHT